MGKWRTLIAGAAAVLALTSLTSTGLAAPADSSVQGVWFEAPDLESFWLLQVKGLEFANEVVNHGGGSDIDFGTGPPVLEPLEIFFAHGRDSGDMLDWRIEVFEGSLQKRDISIALTDSVGADIAVYCIYSAWPASWELIVKPGKKAKVKVGLAFEALEDCTP